VRPESFYVPAHRLVCEAIYAVSEKRSGVDVLLVISELRQAEKLEAVGGGLALDRLIQDTPTAEHGEYYLDIVRQKDVVRQALRLFQESERECYGDERGDVIAARMADRLMNLVAAEGPVQETNVEVLERKVQRWRDAKAKKEPAIGLRLPWETLTELICGLEEGMTVLAGRPSMGKTTLEDQICVELAAQGIPVGRVTIDSTRGELMQRAVCRMAGVSLPKLKFGFARESQLAQVEEAKDVLGKYPLYINDQDRDISVICPWARMMKARYGIQLLTVDFVQIVTAAIMGRQQWDEVACSTYVSGMLKRLSLELHIPVLALSQLNRGSAKDGKLRPPTLADLRSTGALEQDAHKVLAVYRDE
jgi:replicative DNA helicase